MIQRTRDLALEPVEVLFKPGPDYWEAARNWQGIPGIERTDNGRLWAAWYTGGRTEDEHNHSVLVTSDDDGETWSKPVLAIDPPADIRSSDPVLWIDPLGRLWMFWMQTKHCGVTFDGRGGVWAIRLDDPDTPDGEWTKPQRVANGIMMNKPTVLESGDWLLPTAVWTHNAPYELVLPEEAFSNVTISRDQGETFDLLGSADVPNNGPDENMIIERRDGTLWMLVRRKDGIGEAISQDGGKTWDVSPDVVIDGPNARFHIRRLRSGRLLLINHRNFTKRDHLTASLSEDDGKTWIHHLLLDERDDVSYPDAKESPDGTIWIIHDRQRVGVGEILLRKITEDDILNGREPGDPIIVSQLKRPHIGTRRELFVDDFLADQMEDVSFKLHHPTPREIVFEADKPWEGGLSGYVTVFQDEGKYRMYYKGYPRLTTLHELPPHPLWNCYAESNDGLTWERPDLGFHEFAGSKKNNIIQVGFGEEGKVTHGFTPFRDDNPDCPPEERYKAVGGVSGPEAKTTRGDLHAAVSPDGIHWKLMSEEPILKNREHGFFDSQNLAFWDAERCEYRIYFRDYRNYGKPSKVRTIKTATSKDFRHWENVVELAYPGCPTTQLYTSQVQPYYRAPHLFLGFPARYTERKWSPTIEALPELENRKFRSSLNERMGAALTDSLFMASRDGEVFKRWDEAFIRPGPVTTGNWVYGDNFQALGMYETASSVEGGFDELSFLVVENYWGEAGSRFRRHSIRIDGFVSVNAPFSGGQISLKPFRFDGSTLSINFATSAAGSIRVQMEDFGGHPLEGFAFDDCHEIVGDEIDRVVHWRNGAAIGAHAGRMVRMRFELKDADLYSFRFQD